MLFGAFYILFKDKDVPAKKYLFFIAGLCLGLAALLDYMLNVGSIFIAAYAFMSFRRERLFNYASLALGALLIAFIFGYYHYLCFENPFATATTYSQMIGRVPLSLPRPGMIFELTFGTYRGMFIYMPVFLFSVYGVFLFFKRPEKKYMPEMLLVSFFALAIFIIMSIFCNWAWPWGGDFGPRYFTCLIPFLMLPIAFIYKKIKYKIILFITLFSVLINWCGVQYGDADNAFTNIGLFIFRGLNSNLTEWLYGITNAYIRKMSVITHFSPFMAFLALGIVIYRIWKDEIKAMIYEHR